MDHVEHLLREVLDVNGLCEAGLAGGQDAGLSLNQRPKFPVSMFRNKDHWVDAAGTIKPTCIGSSASSLTTKYSVYTTVEDGVRRLRSAHPVTLDVILWNELILSAAAMGSYIRANFEKLWGETSVQERMMAGTWLVALSKGWLNDEWQVVADPEGAPSLDSFEGEELVDWCKKGITLGIMGTISWYATNHHTGPAPLSSQWQRVLKGLGIIDSGSQAEIKSKEFVTSLWRAVHPINSRFVLASILNDPFPNKVVAVVDSRFPRPVIVKFAADFELRFRGSPAGTHRIIDSVEVLKKLATSLAMAFLPSVNQLPALIARAEEIKRAGWRCHLGAAWIAEPANDRLAGLNQDPVVIDKVNQREIAFEDVVTELGAAAVILFAGKSLSKAPVMKTASEECYNESWKNILESIVTISKDAPPDAVLRVMASATGVSSGVWSKAFVAADKNLELQAELATAMMTMGNNLAATGYHGDVPRPSQIDDEIWEQVKLTFNRRGPPLVDDMQQ